MLELKLYEVVSELNSRGEMGRVVVPPSLPKDLSPRGTGNFFLCCNRFFLTLESFESHRNNDCRMTKEIETEKKSIVEIIRQACTVDKESLKNEWKYSCKVVDVKRLVARKKKRNGAINFLCRKCNYGNGNLQRIVRHVKTNHAEDLDQRKIRIGQDKGHGENSDEDHEDNSDDGQYRPSRFYKCDMCNNYESTYKWNIVLHKEKAHVKDGNYPCSYCTCRYETQIGLQLHLNRVHNNLMRNNPNSNLLVENPSINQVNKCPNTGIFSNQQTTKSKYVSDWVQQSVEQLQNQNVIQQMEIAEPVRNQPTKSAFSYYKCAFCPVLFEEKAQLIKHNRQQHRPAITKVKEEPSSPLDKKKPESKQLKPSESLHSANKMSKLFELEKSTNLDTLCDLCGFIAKDASDLSLHLKVAHVFLGVECECGCSFTTATELTNHKTLDCVRRNNTNLNVSMDNVKQEGLKKYSCDCGRSFETRRKFSKHQEQDKCQINEHDVKPSIVGHDDSNTSFKTPKIMETSVTQTELGKLQNTESNIERKTQCPYCKNYFKNEMGLGTHIAQIHKTSQWFDACEVCKYATKTHRLYHSHKKACHVPGGIPCPAEDCSCTFKTIESLTGHFRQIHKGIILDRKKMELKCDRCNFLTYKISDLEKHLLKGHAEKNNMKKTTETHNCKQCTYNTNCFSNLRIHIQANHVENGFKCKFCNNSFRTVAGVQTHTTQMHKKQGPNLMTDEYSICKLCGYITGSLKGYREHYQRCHVGPIKCPECVCTFKHIDGMSKHMTIRHKKKVDKSAYLLKCKQSDCTYTTYNAGNLKHHEMTSHRHLTHYRSSANDDDSKLLKCPMCDENMSSSALQGHIERAHVENGFSCPEDCKCSFRTEQGLSRHMVIKHGKKMNTKKETVRDPIQYPVQCSECDFRSKDQNGVNKHCLKMHGFSVPVPKTKSKRVVCDICQAETSETLLCHKRRYHVANGFKCLHPECSYSFETFHSRARHMQKVHQIATTKRCHICKLKLIGTLLDHMKRCHVKNGLKCMQEDCCCTFETELGRQRHMQARHQLTFSKQPKRCNLCGVVPSIMKTHLSVSHDKKCHVVGGLPCNFCCCTFETEMEQRRHALTRHHIKLSNNCTSCGITPVVSMNAHMKQSHVVGGVPCTYCACAFKTERIRIRHLATYHNVIVKPTSKQCSICKMFISTSLEKHVQNRHVPNGYQCSYCSWSLHTEAGLRIHMFKKHTEHDEQFSKRDGKCELCGMKVTESMRKHMERNHTSTNNFKCNYCCSKFSTSLGRSRHILRRHKNCQNKIVSKKKKVARKRHQKSQPFKIISTFSLANTNTKMIDPPQFFACLYCSCKFASATLRDAHAKLMHSNCTDNRQLSEPTDSPIEEKITYTKIILKSPSLPKEKLTCLHCGYLATCKSHLNMHIQKSHVKNSAFRCNLCSCSFAKGNELIRHKKIFHSDSDHSEKSQ